MRTPLSLPRLLFLFCAFSLCACAAQSPDSPDGGGGPFYTEDESLLQPDNNGVHRAFGKDGKPLTGTVLVKKNGGIVFRIPVRDGLWDGVMQGDIRLPGANFRVEAPFVRGKEEGLRKFWLEKALLSETPYRNGLREGLEREYYTDGALRLETAYSGGKKNGPDRTYYGNGKPRAETTYQDDCEVGPKREFDENGRLLSETTFWNGKPVLRKTYQANGTLLRSERLDVKAAPKGAAKPGAKKR